MVRSLGDPEAYFEFVSSNEKRLEMSKSIKRVRTGFERLDAGGRGHLLDLMEKLASARDTSALAVRGAIRLLRQISLPDAIRLARQAVRHAPEDFELRYCLSNCLYAEGLRNRSQSLLTEALVQRLIGVKLDFLLGERKGEPRARAFRYHKERVQGLRLAIQTGKDPHRPKISAILKEQVRGHSLDPGFVKRLRLVGRIAGYSPSLPVFSGRWTVVLDTGAFDNPLVHNFLASDAYRQVLWSSPLSVLLELSKSFKYSSFPLSLDRVQFVPVSADRVLLASYAAAERKPEWKVSCDVEVVTHARNRDAVAILSGDSNLRDFAERSGGVRRAVLPDDFESRVFVRLGQRVREEAPPN